MKNIISKTTALRAEIYTALAWLYGPPKEILLGVDNKALVSEILEKSSKLYPRDPLNTQDKESMVAFLKNLSAEDKAERLCDLEIEYVRMFRGTGQAPVSPYESVYRDPYGQAMSQFAMDVALLYAEEGLRIASDFKDLPDHIVPELEYMAFLCQKEIEANARAGYEGIKKYFIKEYSFLIEHLSRWVFDFCDKIIHSTSSEFYSSLAKISRDYLHFDIDWLAEKIQELEPKTAPYSDLVSLRRGRLHQSPNVDGFPEPGKVWKLCIDKSKCLFCELCVRVCIPHALEIEKGDDFFNLCFTASRCDGCKVCIMACPQTAISSVSVSGDLLSEKIHTKIVLCKSRLIRCIECNDPFVSGVSHDKVLSSMGVNPGNEALRSFLLLCSTCRTNQLFKKSLYSKVKMTTK